VDPTLVSEEVHWALRPWLDARFLVGASLCFGLVIGSFLNVVIHRLPRGESLAVPGSRCPSCGHPIRAIDNVPVLSFLWLRGRCRDCGASISWRYPAVELFTGLVFAAIAWRFGPVYATPILMLFAAGLIAAALIDFDHQIIPDEISLGGLVLGLFVLPGIHAWAGQAAGQAFALAWAGAALGGGVLWLVAFVHARVSTALGREFEHWPGEGEALPRPSSLDYWTWFPGMGFGDIKLLAMIGAFLGPWGVLETILAASISGLMLGAIWAALKHTWSSPFGFAPAIAVGALVALLVPAGWIWPV
jgi:leader peptidase (prepilin peptidase)/N-methyltransferase